MSITFTTARRQTRCDYRAIHRSSQIALVCLAGEDTLGFWRKRGYTEEAVTLQPSESPAPNPTG